MKKIIFTGIMAASLIAAGGAGALLAQAKDQSQNAAYTEQSGLNIEQMSNSGTFKDMQQFMQEGNVNFGQMKPYMKQMHPELSDQQLEDMYKSMHGTGGAAQSTNFQGMMEKTRESGLNIEKMSNSVDSGTFEDMQQYMQEGNVNFGQMKPYMKQMHPELSDQQLEDMYKSMHGTGGAAQSTNFQGMMGNM